MSSSSTVFASLLFIVLFKSKFFRLEFVVGGNTVNPPPSTLAILSIYTQLFSAGYLVTTALPYM